MKELKELYMEDVGSIASEATDLIIKRLTEYGIQIQGEGEDVFFEPLFEAIENYCENDYKNHL